jgi:hypothetical protein
MNPTVNVLKAESQRLRALVAKIDALILEIEGPEKAPQQQDPSDLFVRRSPLLRPAGGEYSKLTQTEAVLKAIGHGPVRLKELYLRLHSGGSNIKNARYVSSVIARLRDKVQRGDDGVYSLKQNSSTTSDS